MAIAMKIRQVTLTGADESVTPSQLESIQYLFTDFEVEWGILLSKNSEGSPRFPKLKWIKELAEHKEKSNLKLSGHLCGTWVKELAKGDFTFVQERLAIWDYFDRIQINFHGEPHEINEKAFLEALASHPGKQYIIQADGIHNYLVEEARNFGIDAVPLYDKSHGAGITPNSWPHPVGTVYCGYAGGLGPHNLGGEFGQVRAIDKVVGGREMWLDMETHIRSNDDKSFDLEKAKKCLALIVEEMHHNESWD